VIYYVCSTSNCGNDSCYYYYRDLLQWTIQETPSPLLYERIGACENVYYAYEYKNYFYGKFLIHKSSHLIQYARAPLNSRPHEHYQITNQSLSDSGKKHTFHHWLRSITFIMYIYLFKNKYLHNVFSGGFTSEKKNNINKSFHVRKMNEI